MEYMELKICMSDKHHRYYKHTKFRQNPRGDPNFLVDLTWNDPYRNLLNGNTMRVTIAITSCLILTFKQSLVYSRYSC